MTNPPDKVQVEISSTIPQADLFARDQPAILEGPEKAWATVRTLIDFGNSLIATGAKLRDDHRIRHAVLLALLRRALITGEGIFDLLARGLQEPAVALMRSLLDIELNIKLVHRDSSDVMAQRLAAFHYYYGQKHTQDMLASPETREDTLDETSSISDMIAVAKGFAAQLRSDAFDNVRDAVKRDRYWHGYNSPEDAFKAIGAASDYYMTYDLGTAFIHNVNIEFDFTGVNPGQLTLKPLVERNPRVIQTHLAHTALRLRSIVEIFVDDCGLPISPEFKASSTIRFPDGHTEELEPMQAITAMVLESFPRR